MFDVNQIFEAFVWIGASKGSDGSFSWLDGTPFTTPFWREGEPNNNGGKEDSMMMGASGNTNDRPGAEEFPSVCKMKELTWN